MFTSSMRKIIHGYGHSPRNIFRQIEEIQNKINTLKLQNSENQPVLKTIVHVFSDKKNKSPFSSKIPELCKFARELKCMKNISKIEQICKGNEKTSLELKQNHAVLQDKYDLLCDFVHNDVLEKIEGLLKKLMVSDNTVSEIKKKQNDFEKRIQLLERKKKEK